MPTPFQVQSLFNDSSRLNTHVVAQRGRIVRELLGNLRGLRILDIGCGDGSISLQFLREETQLTLVDLSPQMIERARQNVPTEHQYRVTLLNTNVLDLPAHYEFDVVLCLGVLGFVDSLQAFVARTAQFLIPGGRCIFAFTDDSQLAAKLVRTGGQYEDVSLVHVLVPLN